MPPGIAAASVAARSPASAGADAVQAARTQAEMLEPRQRPEDASSAAEVVAPSAPAWSLDRCPKSTHDGLGVLVSPTNPAPGQRVRILAATLVDDAPLVASVFDGEGQSADATRMTSRGGHPASVLVDATAPARGKLRVMIGRDDAVLACVTVVARKPKREVPPTNSLGAWPFVRAWSGAEEALFSAWVRELFHAPRDEMFSFPALDVLTNDVERNVLHDALGWREDSGDPPRRALRLRPDCADLPFFLRAYFAWKRGLPFAFRSCSRGSPQKPPRCGDLHAETGVAADMSVVDGIAHYFRRTLAWGVHTGNGRTPLEDDETDLYPIALTASALRPGTVYADPYGHILIIAEIEPPRGNEPGVLYAVDGQPDGTVSRKRFWEGNFLWNPEPRLGGSGFKHFRPVMLKASADAALLESASNEAVMRMSGYGDVSTEQGRLSAHEFYDRVESIVTPGVRDPLAAQAEAIQALHEAARARVLSVDNGTQYVDANAGRPVPMPAGFAIFETTGPWESFATPARDLRLLIAIDVVRNFAEKVARRPQAFGITGMAQLDGVRARLTEQGARLLASEDHAVQYVRSDGTTWKVTLAELIDRERALEMGYHPNDCNEIRWGAAPGTPEFAPCKRRAPASDHAKMQAYRTWFRERRRPPRGDPGPSVPPVPPLASKND